MLDNSRNEIRKIQSLYLCKLYHVHCTVHSTYSTVYTHVYCIWSKVWAVCGWKVNLKKNKFFEYAHIFRLFINLLLFLHSLLNLLVFLQSFKNLLILWQSALSSHIILQYTVNWLHMEYNSTLSLPALKKSQTTYA